MIMGFAYSSRHELESKYEEKLKQAGESSAHMVSEDVAFRDL